MLRRSGYDLLDICCIVSLIKFYPPPRWDSLPMFGQIYRQVPLLVCCRRRFLFIISTSMMSQHNTIITHTLFIFNIISYILLNQVIESTSSWCGTILPSILPMFPCIRRIIWIIWFKTEVDSDNVGELYRWVVTVDGIDGRRRRLANWLQ